MRLFIAVDIDDVVRAKLSELTKALKGYRGVKVVEPENMHITLQFLGEVKDSRVDLISDYLSEVKASPFKLHIKGLGFFPNRRMIRVIWIGVEEGKEEISNLAKGVRERMRKLGFKEDKDFVAHTTIARVKKISPHDKEKILKTLESFDSDFGWFDVKNFKLKQSTLTPKGPIYKDVSVYNLEG